MNDRSVLQDLLYIFLFGLLLRVLLLLLFPVPYGNDGIGRIYFKNNLFFGHWLPLTQFFVYLSAQLDDNIMAIRATFACLGALSACGFYLFLRMLTSRTMAMIGGLLCSVNSFYIVLSLMPYQDVLFLGLFYSALAFLFKDDRILSSKVGAVFYGLACLTRYESWFILPLLVIWKIKIDTSILARGVAENPRFLKFIDSKFLFRIFPKNSISGYSFKPLVKNLFKSCIFFGWGPIVWFLLNRLYLGDWHGFLFRTLDGTFYAWNPHFDIAWILSYAWKMTFWLVRFATPILLFCLPGLAIVLRKPQEMHPSLKLLLLFCALVLIFFFFIIGKEFETVNRFAVIPMSILLVFAVIGMERSGKWLQQTVPWSKNLFKANILRGGWLFLLMLMIIYSAITVQRLNARPEFRGPFEIANYLDSALQNDEKAVVVAERFRDFSDAAPMAYQRIIVQSKLGQDRILCSSLLKLSERAELLEFARLNHIRFLVIFNNFTPWLPSDRFFVQFANSASQQLRPVLHTDSATLFEVLCWLH